MKKEMFIFFDYSGKVWGRKVCSRKEAQKIADREGIYFKKH